MHQQSFHYIMAPIGNLVRLAPLQLDELPSHPALEARFRKSLSQADPKNGIQLTATRQALSDISNASQGISRSQPNAQRNDPLELKDDSNVVPSEDPNHPAGTSDIIRDETRGGVDSRATSPGILDHTGRPNLIPFIKAVLDEATSFVDMVIPRRFEEGGLKSSSPSTAKVRLLKKSIKGSELSQVPWEKSAIPRKAPRGNQKSSEAWFARSSIHANQNLKGSANFDELDFALRHDHSRHEREYTPDVFDDFKVLEWDFSDMPTGLAIEEYRHITMGSEYFPPCSPSYRGELEGLELKVDVSVSI